MVKAPSLEIKGLHSLIQKFSNLEAIQEVYLFGSRARGDAQERSDIDIAIVCPNATDADWNTILQWVETAPTLIKIDCVRFDSLKDINPLRQAIMRDKVILYKKGDSFMNASIFESFQKTEKALGLYQVI